MKKGRSVKDLFDTLHIGPSDFERYWNTSKLCAHCGVRSPPMFVDAELANAGIKHLYFRATIVTDRQPISNDHPLYESLINYIEGVERSRSKVD